ncbi:hypothetical protein BVX97_04660 [bacterium E08(2017)]|nr:hypothetical protein BVX97_04660 [bacterium E08(2017)]
MHEFKYNRGIHYLNDLSELLLSTVRACYLDEEYDAVTSVPLDSAKMRSRSYNQAELLGRKLAKRLGVQYRPDCAKRTRSISPQVRLNASQRRLNVKGAFQSAQEEWIKGRRFLLVDDVMTTGATVNEVSKVLMESGAEKVNVITVARG